MSELKTFLRSSSLKNGVLSLRAEDIMNAIKSLNDACLISFRFSWQVIESEGVLDDFPDSPQTHVG